ncbi:MAG TPA: LamG-like jellyroll fold domain-containing protein [Verrucomicrobiae bacterium]|nr:LamG-like jellyroll fold domain-containing protein [Verrucomicrobiae bacterium]
MKTKATALIGVVCLLTAFQTWSTDCVSPPPGIVGWWSGEGDAWDSAGTNDGVLLNGTDFAPGEVGLAFRFNGVNNAVRVPASANLNLGTSNGLTLEAWVYPTDVGPQHSVIEWSQDIGGPPYGVHLWIGHDYDPPGYFFANIVDTAGNWHVIGSAPGLVQSNVFQHIAVTYDKTSGLARLFLNGAVVQETNLGVFTPQTTYNLYFGERPPGDGTNPLYAGLIDEIGIYGRALGTNEIAAIYTAGSAGKCAWPTLTQQPQSQVLYCGRNIAFTAGAVGARPLTFQWLKNGTPIGGATAASLSLTNLQMGDAGSYSVAVINSLGSATSGNANLSVIATNDESPGTWTMWWQHSDGAVAVWLMDQTNRTAAMRLNIGGVGTDWKIVGTGDFMADGNTDLLWHHTTGWVALWLMDGTNHVSSVRLNSSPVDPQWRIVGTADFDGNGYPDILWQHSAGWVAVWLMDHTNIMSSFRLNSVPVGPGWNIIGAVKFDGQNSDIVWQNTSGDLAVWQMNGTNWVGQTRLSLPSGGQTWRIVTGVDMLGNGNLDLIWQNDAGPIAYWLMQETNLLRSARFPILNSDPTWRAVGANMFRLGAPFMQGLVAYYPLNGSANDASGYGNNGTLLGEDGQYSINRFGQQSALYLNTTSNPTSNSAGTYIGVANNLDFNQDFTLSAWVNIPNGLGGYHVHSLVSNGSDATSANLRLISNVDTNADTGGHDYLQVVADKTGGSVEDVHAFLPQLRNTWWQATVVRSGTNIALFQNGTLVASGPWPTAVQNNPAIGLGQVPAAFYPLVGAFGDIRMFNRALSTQEVLDLYQYERFRP